MWVPRVRPIDRAAIQAAKSRKLVATVYHAVGPYTETGFGSRT